MIKEQKEEVGRKTEEKKITKTDLFRFHLPSSFFLLTFFFLAATAAAAEPFFVTIQKVELKSSAGEWVTVIEPDKKVDLMETEPTIAFFNNGRVVPGPYVNVRVQLDKGLIMRAEDYVSPITVRKGSFVHVSFGFDLDRPGQALTREHFKHIQLTVDEDERLDGADQIKIGA